MQEQTAGDEQRLLPIIQLIWNVFHFQGTVRTKYTQHSAWCSTRCARSVGRCVVTRRRMATAACLSSDDGGNTLH